jgi:hypothetical protein
VVRGFSITVSNAIRASRIANMQRTDDGSKWLS